MTKFVAFDIDEACNLNAVLFKTARNGRKILPEILGEFSIPAKDKNAKKKFFDFAYANEADILLEYHFQIRYLDLLCGDNTLLDDYDSFLVIDVREVAKAMNFELRSDDFNLNSVALNLGIDRGKNECETIMSVFTCLWGMRTLTFAPYFGARAEELGEDDKNGL